MKCPFCHHEISDFDRKYARCPYCNPELREQTQRASPSLTMSAEFSPADDETSEMKHLEVQQGEMKEFAESDCELPDPQETHIIVDQQETVEKGSKAGSGSESDLASTDFFPGYELKGEIGRGGFGSVILARDNATRRDIALKTFNPTRKAGSTSGIRERFLEEAYITAQLQHPGIVPIYAIARDSSGCYFYTMRPVEGESLSLILDRLREGEKRIEQKFTLRRLVQIMISVCTTMQFAHERGVIHRDLKPSNIIVGHYGEILVIDWGLAKVIGTADEIPTSEAEHVDESNPYGPVWKRYRRKLDTDRTDESSKFAATMDGRVIGTPNYMSPEQALGRIREIGIPSDIWSLGIILFELATLMLPFQGNTLEGTLLNIVNKEPLDPMKANPRRRVPCELAEIIMKCLRKKKEERPGSIKDVIIDLERWIEGIAPWRLLEAFDFTAMPDGPPGGLVITQGDWEIRDGLLCGCDYGGLLTACEVSGDVRMEIDAFVLPGEQGEISSLLSAPDPEKSMFFFDGYGLRLLAEEGTRATIHKGNAELLSRSVDFPLTSLQTVSAERVGSTIRLERNGEELLKYHDFFPLTGSRAGLISIGTGLRVRGLRLYSRGTGVTLSCLDLAKSYQNKGMIGEADEWYRQIYHDHADREEGIEALFRSGLICLDRARDLNGQDQPALFDELLEKAFDLFDQVESSFFAPLGVLGKAMVFELRGEFEREIDELVRAFRDYPEHDSLAVIPVQILSRRYVWEWDTYKASDRLQAAMERVLITVNSSARNPYPLKGVPVDTLDLSDLVTTIEGLRGLELKTLNMAQTHVDDCEPLAGMPLKRLSLPPTVSDLSPLKDLPLEVLDIATTSVRNIAVLKQCALRHCALPRDVTDISPLRGQPLTHLDLSHAAQVDIDPVADLPLTILRLPEKLEKLPCLTSPLLSFLRIPERVSDIRGVADLPLRGIDLSSSRVSDLSPLRGLNLEYITLPRMVTDISALKDMPLRAINIFDTAVTDLQPLLSLKHLEYLSLYPNGLTPGWEDIVRNIPGLKILTCDNTFTPLSPDIFWKAYDRGEVQGSRSELEARSESRLCFQNSEGMEFRWISPGVFLMGSPHREYGRLEREKLHYACLTHGFYMARFPVRVKDFARFVAASGFRTAAEQEGWAYTFREKKWGRTEGASWRNPGFEQTPDHPVVCVNWFDAQAYCAWLSQTEKRHYRLPTETEWEYCCRAGTESAFHGPLDRVCWHYENSVNRTHSVGKKEKNAWGLCDMHGHVLEWCSDWYDDYPEGFVVDHKGPETGIYRVHRSGNWTYHPVFCRAASRFDNHPSERLNAGGFRIVTDDPVSSSHTP